MPWILLFKTGMQARRQGVEMDRAANVFLARFATQPQNAAAKQFDRLAAALGFIPNSSADALLRVDTDAEKDYRAIEPLLKDFLRSQVTKTTGPLERIPLRLRHYLNEYQTPLNAVQSQLLENELPLWEIDFERMSEINYPFPGFINALGVRNLLLLSAIDHSQNGRTDQMLQAMEASWQLNEAIAQRPDLVSQLLVSLTAEQQAGILRHLEGVPAVWQARLSDRSQQDSFSIRSGLQFDAWLQYRVLQRSLLSRIGQVPAHRSLAVGGSTEFTQSIAAASHSSKLFYWFSPAYYLSLKNIDTNETSQRAIAQLSQLDVCQTTRSAAAQRLAQEKTAVWNSSVLPAQTLARRWKDSGDRALALELTQKALVVKQLARSNRWPATLPDLDSKICPGETWLYKHSEDGITLSFSAQINSEALVPLQYQFNQEGSKTYKVLEPNVEESNIEPQL